MDKTNELLCKGFFYSLEQNFYMSIQYFNRAIASNEHDYRGHFYRANDFLNMKINENSKREYLLILQKFSDQLSPCMKLVIEGCIHRCDNHVDLAIDSYKKGYTIDNQNFFAIYFLAYCYSCKSMLDEALQLFIESLSLVEQTFSNCNVFAHIAYVSRLNKNHCCRFTTRRRNWMMQKHIIEKVCNHIQEVWLPL